MVSGSARQGKGGGRPRSAATRSEKVLAMFPAEDAADVDALAAAWGTTRSQVVWAVVHDWLSGVRRERCDLGTVRGDLKAALELALRDEELGRWLRRVATGER